MNANNYHLDGRQLGGPLETTEREDSLGQMNAGNSCTVRGGQPQFKLMRFSAILLNEMEWAERTNFGRRRVDLLVVLLQRMLEYIFRRTQMFEMLIEADRDEVGGWFI